jgi:hypothetical protein
MFGKKHSVSRAALVAADANLAAARQVVERASERISRLQWVIAAESVAHGALEKAIATDGGASLEAFASGARTEEASAIAVAEAGVRAAGVAKRALPAAEAELARAEADVERLEAEKSKRVAAVLAERADVIAQTYREKFIELVALHDELAGIAGALAALGGGDIRLVHEPLQVPRFALPALSMGPEWTPYLTRVSDPKLVSEVGTAWLALGRRLAENPQAKLAVPASTTATPVERAKKIAADMAMMAAAVVG